MMNFINEISIDLFFTETIFFFDENLNIDCNGEKRNLFSTGKKKK